MIERETFMSDEARRFPIENSDHTILESQNQNNSEMPFFLAPLAAKLVGGLAAKGAVGKVASTVATKILPSVSKVNALANASTGFLARPSVVPQGSPQAESFFPQTSPPPQTPRTQTKPIPMWAKVVGAVLGLLVVGYIIIRFTKKRR